MVCECVYVCVHAKIRHTCWPGSLSMRKEDRGSLNWQACRWLAGQPAGISRFIAETLQLLHLEVIHRLLINEGHCVARR